MDKDRLGPSHPHPSNRYRCRGRLGSSHHGSRNRWSNRLRDEGWETQTVLDYSGGDTWQFLRGKWCRHTLVAGCWSAREERQWWKPCLSLAEETGKLGNWAYDCPKQETSETLGSKQVNTNESNTQLRGMREIMTTNIRKCTQYKDTSESEQRGNTRGTWLDNN